MSPSDTAELHPDGEPGVPEVTARIRQRSIEEWGPHREISLIGRSDRFVDALRKLEKIAQFDEPVLVTGESGVGKEKIAESIYLLSGRRSKPFISMNCPQFREGNLTVSELFGHQRGSFTGAIADRKGAFELADEGVLFLDEIADLHLDAQAMLLRALATGEYKAIGADRTHIAKVRVVAATNRPLKQMVSEQQFRNDLFFRLRYFILHIPPLRERGDDWKLLVDMQLEHLHQRYGETKSFSRGSIKLLEDYDWPGNVRQLICVVTMGYAMAEGTVIEPNDFASHLETSEHGNEAEDTLFSRVVDGKDGFWDTVYKPFMERDLNRLQVKAFVRQGLLGARGSYRELLNVLNLPSTDYQKLMDFLRHHQLKP